jgi:hypothetical protein
MLGEHLSDDHAGPLLAQRLGRDHAVAADDSERHSARDHAWRVACGVWRVGDTDEHDDHPRVGLPQSGEHDQRQPDLRDRRQDVVEAHESVVPSPPA